MSNDLPRRRREGYRVTDILLEVVGSHQIARRIAQEVALPAPPRNPVTTMQLSELIASLQNPALRAARILEAMETAAERSRYALPIHERVQIKVLSGGRLVGRVDGAQRTFNETGTMTSPGLLAHPRGQAASQPPNRKRRPRDDRQ